MTKFREHRGSLAESMETTVEVDGRAGLLAHIRKLYSRFCPAFVDEDVSVRPYSKTDNRIGWKDVHIVVITDHGVVGFTDGPVQ